MALALGAWTGASIQSKNKEAYVEHTTPKEVHTCLIMGVYLQYRTSVRNYVYWTDSTRARQKCVSDWLVEHDVWRSRRLPEDVKQSYMQTIGYMAC